MVHPLIGKKAPEVTLPDANSAPYDLKPGASGRPLALFFYPAAGTYGCTREACSFRDALSSSDVFKSTECDVVGISKDPPAQQKAFVDQNGLPYPVLSDAEGKAREAYEVGRGLFNLTEGRATFMIDRDGTVLDVYESVIQYNEHRKFVERWLAKLGEKKEAETETAPEPAPAPEEYISADSPREKRLTYTSDLNHNTSHLKALTSATEFSEKMTSTASLHFGPEWMRKPTRPSPVSPAANGTISNPTHQPNGITSVNGHHTGSTAGAATTNSSPANTLLTQSSYSSLLASPVPPEPLSDSSNPFRYSREQMYTVWKNGGGQGELGLEVERWPGIVREDAIQPLGLTDYSPEEKRLYALPYNSDPPPVRRRGDSYSAQSPLATTPGGLDPTRDRNKLANASRGFGNGGSIGSVGVGSGSSSLGMGLPSRRKKDENGQDVPVYRPRQLSLGATGNQNGPPSPGGGPSPGGVLTRSRLSSAGFDGVMGDSWAGAARRRVSDPRAQTVTNRGEDKMEGSWRRDDSRFKDDIAEEPVADWEQAADSEAPPTDSSTSKDTVDSVSRPDSARRSPPNTDPSIPIESHLPNGVSALPSASDSYNPEAISWCYKDPTGQVQGPFAAPTMQSWYLGNYFADDLLLKRIDIDPDFEELQDFKRRVIPPGTAETLFISRIAAKLPVIPPGLANQLGAGLGHPLAQLQNPLARPDPFANDPAGALTSPIVNDPQAYPSGAPFGNAFPPLGGLGIGGFGNEVDRQRREREDFLRSLREKELASRGVGVAAIGGIGAPLGGLDMPNGAPLGGNNLVGGVFPNAFGNPEPFTAQSPIQSFGQPSPFGVNGLGAHPLQGGGLDSFYSPVTPQNQQQGIWPRTPHSAIPEQAPAFVQNPVATAAVTPSWMSIIEQQPPSAQFDVAAAAAFHNAPVQQPTSNSFSVGPTWDQEPPIEAPIASVVAEVLDEPPIEVATELQQPAIPDEEPQDLHPDPVESEPIDPSTAVTAADSDDLVTGLQAMDLNQAPVPEEVKQAIIEEETIAPVVPTPKKSSKRSAPAATGSSGPTPTVSTISQSGVSVTSTRSAISTTAPASAVEPEQPSATTPSTAPKTAWSNFGEERPSSLRKIQEAEAKKAAEAKKVEKERVAKTTTAVSVASPASTAGSVAEATGSWGLPQVGRAPTASAPSPAPSTGSAGGVWATKPSQVTKKSMKEIQDEEEKRKKAVAQAQAAAAAAVAASAPPAAAAPAAKRGYADSAKPTSGAAPSQPNGWTTIGTGGKAMAPATTAAATATATTAAAATARPTPPGSRPSTASVPGAPAASSSGAKPAAKSAPSAAKPADETPPPSLEFIRWMRDALRGLTGANVDEFMQMLLSFPLDPSPTVVEIISDSVYASSATLDGRRFASEFVAKRKADAANAKAQDAKQAGAWAGRVSLAEVVKTQPKPAESEWSTRVVKKNKKGRNGGN